MVATLEGQTGVVTDIAFSADGARVLTSSGDNTAGLWVAATGQDGRRAKRETRATF